MRTVEACVICQYYLTDRPVVCVVCRARMARDLDDLLEAWLLLDAEPGRSDGPRITGTRDKPLPARVTVLDLQLHATSQQAIHDPYGDQVGHIPVATVLDAWVRAWGQMRDEDLPVSKVPLMVLWLKKRIDWACDNYDPIADYAAEIRSILAACRAVNGVTVDTISIGPCAAVDHNGVECGYRLRADPYVDNITCRRCQTVWPKRNWLWLHDRSQPIELDLDAHAC